MWKAHIYTYSLANTAMELVHQLSGQICGSGCESTVFQTLHNIKFIENYKGFKLYYNTVWLLMSLPLSVVGSHALAVVMMRFQTILVLWL